MARLVQRPQAPDAELIDDLVAEGLDRLWATRLVVFLPTGFLYFFFDHPHLPDTFDLLAPGAPPRTYRIADEPIFAAARDVAAEVYTRSKAEFSQIMARSSMFEAIEAGLKAGVPIAQIALPRLAIAPDIAAIPWAEADSWIDDDGWVGDDVWISDDAWIDENAETVPINIVSSVDILAVDPITTGEFSLSEDSSVTDTRILQRTAWWKFW